MKTFFAMLACSAALVAPATAAEGWMTDFPAAQKKAQAENKLVLVDFTGSDWCRPCVELQRNVLDTPEFRQYTADKFVLMQADLPRRAIDGKLREANEALAARYNVASYPTILVVTPEGKIVGGFEGSVESVKGAILPLEHAREAARSFSKAEKLSGEKKAQLLMSVYRHFPSSKGFSVPQAALRAEILQADPHNTTGIAEEAAAIEQAAIFLEQRSQFAINDPAMGKLLEQQLREALPPNRTGVMMERCQYAMATAESVEDIHETRRMFEELIPLLPADEAAEIRHYVDTYFADAAALLQMLKAGRPR